MSKLLRMWYFGKMFGQFASTAQFYLYGKSHCTSTGWEKHRLNYGKTADDIVLPIFGEGSGKVNDNGEEDKRDLTGRVFLVTGANAGIGKEVSSYLVHKGAILYMVCRNLDRAQAAKNEFLQRAERNGVIVPQENVRILIGDCGLESDVRKIWEEFTKSSEKLDCLICNAGALSFEKEISKEGVEVTFATHLLFGTYLLGSLALETLSRTPNSRLIAVSSGGMYNTRFPSWADATSTGISKYDGQLSYAYAKRGQVLLCERWAEQYDGRVKVLSCHPGWTLTPGVDAAYGESKSYLQPLRSLWQGAEGIIWLAVTDKVSALQGGAFYLDRSPCVKHMAGPFFTEGSFTKNSREEVDNMMENLEKWSNAATRPSLAAQSIERAKALPLAAATDFSLDVDGFMGKWHVLANIPTFLEVNLGNCIEEYQWNDAKKRIDITFSYRSKGSSESSASQMKAVVTNPPHNTHWHMSPKLLGSIFMPVNLDYLIVDKGSEPVEYVTVGVPNRNYLWIMTRQQPSEFADSGKGSSLAVDVYDIRGEEGKGTGGGGGEGGKEKGEGKGEKFEVERLLLQKAIARAEELGYDPKQIVRVPWSN